MMIAQGITSTILILYVLFFCLALREETVLDAIFIAFATTFALFVISTFLLILIIIALGVIPI
jgi:hypothetical protein